MKIKDKEYDLIFNFSVWERLEELWECDNLVETMQKATDMQKGKVRISDIRKMLEASLIHTDLTHTDIMDHLNSCGPAIAPLLNDILMAMTKALPKEEKGSKKKT